MMLGNRKIMGIPNTIQPILHWTRIQRNASMTRLTIKIMVMVHTNEGIEVLRLKTACALLDDSMGTEMIDDAIHRRLIHQFPFNS